MSRRHSPVVLLACGAWAAAAVVRGLAAQPPAATASAQQIEFFESRIRPIFVERCSECHTDEERGDLRVDSREALLKGGASGPAIVPGDPDRSLLMRAVRRETGVPKMPKGGDKLPDAEIAALAEWIRTGAPWPPRTSTTAAPPVAKASTPEMAITAEHRAFWSFQPIRSMAPPEAKDPVWAKTGIDRFILSRLEREGLTPVKAADKRTLIRRATLDLTGLPPTMEEIEAFEKDGSPDAFAHVVDRLLASPHYGEAWGRKWLDVARYSEDDPRSLDPQGRGYAPYPNAYLYRDWVIRAFNDDLPYDQFVRAQLAADLLDESIRVRMLPALGFLGLGPWYYDNGAVEITRADERHDRVDVVSRGFLGLTVACARCHDHKYDPIPTRDYYALAGVFLNTTYREYPQAPASVVDDYKAQEKKIKSKEKLLGEFQSKERQQLAEALTLQASRYMQAAWRVTGEPKKDKAAVANEEKLDYELFDRWLYFLAKPPKFYPFLAPWQEMIARGGTKEEARKIADDFQALLVSVMFEHKEIEEENDIIRAKALPGTKKKEPSNKPNEFVTNDDFCPGCGLELKSMPADRMQLWLDVYARDLSGNAEAQNPDAEKPALLSFTGWALERQLSAERRQYINDLREDVKTMRKALPPQYAYVHGVGDVEKPSELPLAIRGNPNRSGEPVPRHFLTVLSDGAPAALGAKGSGRLELADEILRQPITSRVIVNRIWKGHFGTGLVNTPSNFGKLGERPTHPELLDYLAQWFLDHGRSIKQLHREIMLSAVYQLGSDDSAPNIAKDAGNRLYWRMSRRRMSAEEIRDSVLKVSGDLDLKVGGPSAPLTPSYKRRTVYGRVSRYRLDQFLQLFDFPAPTITAEQRYSTNVPLQRLFFMNSDFVQQQAEKLARALAEEPDNASRIARAYRTIYGRVPLDAELKAGLAYLSNEPMRAYEERRAEQEAAKAKAEAATKDKTGKKTMASDAATKPEDGQVPNGAPPVDGMMAGVVPGAGGDGEDAKKLPVTPLGRYLKVLLSSNEFLFID
jgi:mono/diheme cytochrome c family protein